MFNPIVRGLRAKQPYRSKEMPNLKHDTTRVPEEPQLPQGQREQREGKGQQEVWQLSLVVAALPKPRVRLKFFMGLRGLSI